MLSEMGVPMLREDGSWGFQDQLASGSGSNSLPAAEGALESAPASPPHSTCVASTHPDILLNFGSGIPTASLLGAPSLMELSMQNPQQEAVGPCRPA